MKFQLDFSFNSPVKISCRDKVLLTGSCFAEDIGEKFASARFNCKINPFGILFNPKSILDSLFQIIHNHSYSEKDLVEHDHLWHSMNHHGIFSAQSRDETLKKINTSIQSAHSFLQQVNWLVVTFGSAIAWRYNKTGGIVANCHKIPGIEFNTVLLEPGEIVSEWKNLLKELKEFNPSLKTIFTVSPVRHTRHGLTENNVSKATLLLAVHQLCAEKDTLYFPSYEIVNDVLRDYRFFKEDLVHPNRLAVDFVWEKFLEGFLDEETKNVLTDIEKFNALCAHRVIHKTTATEELQVKKIQKEKERLSEQYPFLYWG